MALLLGGHDRLSFPRAFSCLAGAEALRRLRRAGISGGLLDAAYVKCQQAVTHHPRLMANTRDREAQILAVCLTYQCDRDCSFCYARGLKEEFREHMSLEDFTFLAGWAREQGWQRLRLLGGEPTQHPRFREILEVCRDKGLTVYITTNGLYDPALNSALGRDFVRSVCLSYPQEAASPEQLERFRGNFLHAADNNRVSILSWVVTPGDEGWRKAVALVKERRTRAMARFSAVLPGHAGTFGPEEFRARFAALAAQITAIARHAKEEGVVFAFYRPLLPCMFSPEQLAFLEGVSPFLFYTRCPLCLGGDHDSDLKFTVNPDLTCYPCTGIKAAGVKIRAGVTRSGLNKSFRPLVREASCRPLMEACRDCRFFAAYQARLGDKPQDLADRTVCQGGCFQYRAGTGRK